MGRSRVWEAWIGASLFVAVACGGESATSGSSGTSSGGDESEAPIPSGGDRGTGGGERGGTANATGGAGRGVVSAGGGQSGGTGGLIAAGGFDAGSGTAGDGGMANASAGSGGVPPPFPAACAPVTQSEQSTKCALELKCDEAHVSVVCGGDGDGDWSCSCRGLLSESYAVQAPTSGTACAAAAALCSGESPIDRNSPEACTIEETRSSRLCWSSTTCRFELELSGILVVVEPLERIVACEDLDAGIASCECPDEPGVAHLFQGYNLDEGCEFAQRFCNSTTRTAVGPPNCEPQASAVFETSCELGRACERQIELDDGTVVALYSTDYTGCGETNGSLHCECQEKTDSFAFERASAESVTLDTCWQARDLCEYRDDLVRGSAIECETVNQSSSPLSCQLALECVQDARIGDVDIGLQGTIQASCYQDEPAWTCICLSGTGRADIAVESTDSWSACNAAAEACPELVADTLSR